MKDNIKIEARPVVATFEWELEVNDVEYNGMFTPSRDERGPDDILWYSDTPEDNVDYLEECIADHIYSMLNSNKYMKIFKIEM